MNKLINTWEMKASDVPLIQTQVEMTAIDLDHPSNSTWIDPMPSPQKPVFIQEGKPRKLEGDFGMNTSENRQQYVKWRQTETMTISLFPDNIWMEHPQELIEGVDKPHQPPFMPHPHPDIGEAERMIGSH